MTRFSFRELNAALRLFFFSSRDRRTKRQLKFHSFENFDSFEMRIIDSSGVHSVPFFARRSFSQLTHSLTHVVRKFAHLFKDGDK